MSILSNGKEVGSVWSLRQMLQSTKDNPKLNYQGPVVQKPNSTNPGLSF